jgi:hypothetical protein
MGAFAIRAASWYGMVEARGIGRAWDAAADRSPVGARVEMQPFAVGTVFVPQEAFSLRPEGDGCVPSGCLD